MIEDNTFTYCSSVPNFLLPENITKIGYRAFYSCSQITNITIPQKVTEIGSYVFSYCTNLKQVTLSKNVAKIGECAFEYCYSITTLTIPESLKSIEEKTFLYCNFTSIIIPKYVTRIRESAFAVCKSLITLSINSNLTEIEKWAFHHCPKLQSIAFLCTSYSITIGDDAFSDISNPINIYIPGNFTIQISYQNAFPNRSQLFITSNTILSTFCKSFFGKQSVIVHFDGTSKISDKTTIEVLDYISIQQSQAISSPLIFKHQFKCNFIFGMLPFDLFCVI